MVIKCIFGSKKRKICAGAFDLTRKMAEFVYDFLNVLIFVARLSQCIKHECALAVGSISLCYFLGKLREKIAESMSYVISD